MIGDTIFRGHPSRAHRRALTSLSTAALVAAGLAACGDDSDDSEANEDAPADAEAEASGSSPTTDELEDVVTELQDFVAEARGLDFLEPVEVEIAEGDDFEERLLEWADLDASLDDMAVAEVSYKALGLIEEDVDLASAANDLLTVGVRGFYDVDSSELVVLAADLGPLERSTIVHELVHALEDQHFDLDRPELEDAEDERSFGFAAVVEGSATVIETEYVFSLDSEEQGEAMAGANGMVDDFEQADLPDILAEEMSLPYHAGATFVQALLDEVGQEALDQAFDDPPTTSAQVLDPGAYLDREAPIEVAEPAADGDVLDEGPFGRASMSLVLADNIPPREAIEAATGWGGGAAVTWQDGDAACVRLQLVGKSPQDSDTMSEAWSTWAENASVSATVDQDGSNGELTVTSCSG